MSGIALALMIGGVVIIRGALKGLTPVDAFRDIFDRATGGEGLRGVVANLDPARHETTDFGGLPSGPGDGGASGSNGNRVSGPFPAEVEQWRGLVSTHFPAGVVNQALSVLWCESRGDQNATNPASGAMGLFQHLPRYWDDRSRRAGVPGASAYDPGANVRVAAWLYKQSGTWSHWSCKPTVGIGG